MNVFQNGKCDKTSPCIFQSSTEKYIPPMSPDEITAKDKAG